MKKILFVSHCILNTASKVVLYNKDEIEAEEELRLKFLNKAISEGIQIIQLPCPEFTLYGPRRWGHTSNQFDNTFFRKHCKKILTPIIDQLKEYLANEDFFEVLGIVGIDGSPSCGVDYTCFADWYGSFECRQGLEDTLSSCKLIKKSGIFMDVLKEMLREEGLEDKVKLTSLYAPEPEKCLNIIS
ncbi:MAG: CD3072 family TudS-related putative desulfidase [Candidatus Avilachnospira sp.]|jgi:predicted secreted protein